MPTGQWTDPFTGTVFQWENVWEQKVRHFLANQLVRFIQKKQSNGANGLANDCARFWKHYYELIFPLRFGKGISEDTQELFAQDLFSIPDSQQVILEWSSDGCRESFIDGTKLPPILNSQTDLNALMADHHLSCAALLNVSLRSNQNFNNKLIDEVRLGVLLHELVTEDGIIQILENYPLGLELAQYLDGKISDCPSALQEFDQLIQAVHKNDFTVSTENYEIFIVGVAAQRIKQYVFESAGLNEIRGASALLDDCVSSLALTVSQEIGPEVVLQSVASTLTFLAPSDANQKGESWTECLKRYFHNRTRSAFVAAASAKVSLNRLSQAYAEVMRDYFSAIETDRNLARTPLYESLPFEKRCEFCFTRAAEGFTQVPSDSAEETYKAVCRPCITKRNFGQKQRIVQQRNLFKWLNVDPTVLGIGLPEREHNSQQRNKLYTQDLSSLIPDKAAHKHIAMIYGDGSNFGPIVKNLKSLAQALHWTHRAEKVAMAAAAIALGKAIQESAGLLEADYTNQPPLDCLPYQILAIGGDDLSLFVWGSVSLRFCQVFLELTDLEFKIGNGERIVDKNKPICFGLGALICDEKAPVKRVVEFTETGLLKWAKKAVPMYKNGTMAFILASNAEQIPGDLEQYQKQMYFSHSHDASACLTLRPLTSKELNVLLDCAVQLKRNNHSGRLQRLVEAFVDRPLLPALLHYIYQHERNGKARTEFFNILQSLNPAVFLGGSTHITRVFPAFQLNRPVTGIGNSGKNWFSPLWDLMEMIKILQARG